MEADATVKRIDKVRYIVPGIECVEIDTFSVITVSNLEDPTIGIEYEW